jgi:glycosyltransferase involved in cell wall biosynthesis
VTQPSGKQSVVHLLPDKLGGIFSLHANLIRHRPAGGLSQHLVLTHNRLGLASRSTDSMPTDSRTLVEYELPLENLYAVLRRLSRAVPAGDGVLLATDAVELAMLHTHPTPRTTIQIVHDDYYVDLARVYGAAVDLFVTHSRHHFDKLRAALPDRSDHIRHLPYGVPLAPRVRAAVAGPLRLAFLGRLTEMKGVFDLPQIDQRLVAAGVEARWTVIGDGPERERLAAEWSPPRVQYLRPKSNTEVLDLLASNDVLVFPTRFEGFPVALLEGMGAGLVPVVTDLPSGVPEVVSQETGYRLPAGDCAAFANAVLELNSNRDRFERMSLSCRRVVTERHEVGACAARYHALFEEANGLRRPRQGPMPPPGLTRLDYPWLPNAVVYTLRRLWQGRRREA